MIGAVKLIHELRSAGMDHHLSEVVVDVIHQSLQHNFATREDMAKLEGKVDLKFTEFEHRMDQRFADFEHRVDQRFAEFEHRMDQRFAEVDQKFAEMDKRFSQLEIKFDGLAPLIENRLLLKIGTMNIAMMSLFLAIIKLKLI